MEYREEGPLEHIAIKKFHLLVPWWLENRATAVDSASLGWGAASPEKELAYAVASTGISCRSSAELSSTTAVGNVCQSATVAHLYYICCFDPVVDCYVGPLLHFYIGNDLLPRLAIRGDNSTLGLTSG